MIGLWAICTIRMFAFHRRTSKNQRKAQRKKWSLKEGSKHEDLALLDELKKLITRIDSMRGNLAYSANYWYLSKALFFAVREQLSVRKLQVHVVSRHVWFMGPGARSFSLRHNIRRL